MMLEPKEAEKQMRDTLSRLGAEVGTSYHPPPCD